MESMLVYPIGSTEACHFAAGFLHTAGIKTVDHPCPEVTHLLLDVPSFQPDGRLRDGGDLNRFLEMLPPQITVAGGNLEQPLLAGYRKTDLLQDPLYVAENAALTADCALRVAAPELKTAFFRCPVLVIGWGRIGKSLSNLLKALGAEVTIAARKEADWAMIQALGFDAVDIPDISGKGPRFRLMFNTVPALVLTGEDLSGFQNCVKIDLASKPGLQDSSVIWAKGLPGIHVPESSGRLIADTFIRLTGRV